MTEDNDAVKEERPLVTFALFAYNQEKYIREAVEGAFSQTYEPLEIIMSDDCSCDRTFEIMQEMASEYKGPHRVIVRRSEKNLGLAGHLNEVLNISRGDIITWAAGDDIALSERTEALVLPLLLDEAIIGVHSKVVEIDSEGKIIRERDVKYKKRMIALSDIISNGTSLISQSHAFRRSVYVTFGPFRPDLTNEGIVMSYREALLGRIVFIDIPLTKYRIGVGTSTYNGHNINRLRISEPKKVSGWYLTAFQQMLDDAIKYQGPESSEHIHKIKLNIAFYTNLNAINSGKRVFSSLIRNTIMRPLDLKSVRASIRIMLPNSLYRFKVILK